MFTLSKDGHAHTWLAETRAVTTMKSLTNYIPSLCGKQSTSFSSESDLRSNFTISRVSCRSVVPSGAHVPEPRAAAQMRALVVKGKRRPTRTARKRSRHGLGAAASPAGTTTRGCSQAWRLDCTAPSRRRSERGAPRPPRPARRRPPLARSTRTRTRTRSRRPAAPAAPPRAAPPHPEPHPRGPRAARAPLPPTAPPRGPRASRRPAPGPRALPDPEPGPPRPLRVRVTLAERGRKPRAGRRSPWSPGPPAGEAAPGRQAGSRPSPRRSPAGLRKRPAAPSGDLRDRFAPRAPSCPGDLGPAPARPAALTHRPAQCQAPGAQQPRHRPDPRHVRPQSAAPPAPAPDCACASSRARTGDEGTLRLRTTHCACAQEPRTVALSGTAAPRPGVGGGQGGVREGPGVGLGAGVGRRPREKERV